MKPTWVFAPRLTSFGLSFTHHAAYPWYVSPIFISQFVTMLRKYLGDSYDIVKRFFAESLSEVAPLYAHPRFIPGDLVSEFEKLVRMTVLNDSNGPTGSFGIFLDPDTGIPLPKSSSMPVSRSHAPVNYIAAELRRLNASYVICFDQSHDRGCGLPKADQRQRKMAALASAGLGSFYYVSHAPFLFAAANSTFLRKLNSVLVERGLPSSRFEALDDQPGFDGLTAGEADAGSVRVDQGSFGGAAYP